MRATRCSRSSGSRRPSSSEDELRRLRLTGTPPVLRTALSLLAGEDLPLDVLEDLLDSLQGEPEMVRRLLFVLSRSEEPGAVDLLIEVARTTEDRELRLEAIRHLQERDEPAAREFLRETLRGPS